MPHKIYSNNIISFISLVINKFSIIIYWKLINFIKYKKINIHYDKI